jgi:iron complex outermembrane recepter protein
MTRYCVRPGIAAVVLTLILIPAGVTLAQTAEKSAAGVGGLEEVVVTATRREERLQDVPVSVSAFSQVQLDAQGLKNIDDLTRLAPGVTFSRTGMTSSGNYNDETSDINIRGIDSSAGTSTSGIYIDDTPIQSRHIGFGAVNAFPALFDLDRVEVLRGPQGTLFGAGAEGGAVRFITPAPSLKEQTGYARAELVTTKGGDPSYELGVATGGPIVDDVLGYRVSASFRRDGGWVDRVAYTRAPGAPPTDPTVTYAGDVEKASNFWRTFTGRVALTWKPNDSLKVTPSLYYQRLYLNDTAAYWPALSNPDGNVYRNGNRLPNPSTDPFYLGSIKVDWDLGFAALTSNTAYLKRDQHSVSDYSQYLRANYQAFGYLPSTYPPAGASGYAVFGDTQRNFYQEVRLASTDKAARASWNVGIFYAHLNENIPENIYDATLNAESGGAVCGTDPYCLQSLISYNPINRVVDKQVAAFGEVGFKVTDSLTGTVGVRVAKVDYTATIYNGGAFVGELIQGVFSSSEKPVTPKAVISWKADADNLFYASAAKGYRVGGANVGVGQNCELDLAAFGLPVDPVTKRHIAPVNFNSDSLWSYELGAKNTLLNRRLQINTSIFRIDWKNIQQFVYLTHCGEGFDQNLGQVRSVGGDIEFQYQPVDELFLGLTAAYVNAKYTRNSCAGTLVPSGTQCADPSNPGALFFPIVTQGDRLLGAPWSFVGSVEYRFAEWGGRKPYLRADLQYQTAQSSLLPTQNPNDFGDPTIPSLPVNKNLSLRGGLRFGGFDVSLFAQNLTNANPALVNSRDIASPNDVLYFARGVRPRTIGITGTYHY